MKHIPSQFEYRFVLLRGLQEPLGFWQRNSLAGWWALSGAAGLRAVHALIELGDDKRAETIARAVSHVALDLWHEC